MDTVGSLADALDDFTLLLDGVDTGQWAAPTPCPNWSVRDLANHITAGNLLVTSLLGGAERPAPEELARRQATDFLGSDPAAAFRASADQLITAFSDPEALERPIVMPIGTVPGAAVAGLRLTETVVHGWDLAAATGQPVPFSDEAVAGALAFTSRALADLPPTNRAFAAPTIAPDDATPLQQLISRLGRDGGWTAS
jgi:uncharacterized protein (TIGR03086 family)